MDTVKKLSTTYLKLFVFRYGIILLAVILIMGALCLLGPEKNGALFTITLILGMLFFSVLSLLDYRRLKKNIRLASVSLVNNTLWINGQMFTLDSIREITPLSVGEGINDKNAFSLIEIRMADGKAYYFLDQPLDWKFRSRTIKLLRRLPELSLKIREERTVTEGLASLSGKL